MLKLVLSALVAILLAIAIAWWTGPSLLRSEGDMADPRSEIHAAELDGVIYVAGGIGFFQTLKSCAAFDTKQVSFESCPDLPRPLHHVAMASGEGRIFASGGYSSLPFEIDKLGGVFMLEPRDQDAKWTQIGWLPEPLGQHAMVYHLGALWLVGGDLDGATTGQLLRFDLARQEWQKMAPMPTPRHSHAIAIENDSLYVTGGRSRSLGSQSRVVEVYNFSINSWSTLPDAPFDLAGHGATVLDGTLHVYGGEELDTARVLRKHAALNLSDMQSGWNSAAAMTYPRHGFATARVGETAWIIGGGNRAGIRTPWSVTGTAFPLPLRENRETEQ